jgi:hypothetical protein
VSDALVRSRIAASLVASTDTGDGLLLLVEPEVSKARLLHLTIGMAGALALDNQHAPAAHRMRLRVVAHAGEMLADARGHTGASLSFAARLLDADAARAVPAASPAAELVLVVSDEVYEGVVRHAYAGVDPAAWQPVRVHAKETSTRAWVHLPGLAAQPQLPAVLVAMRVGPASLPIPRELPSPAGDFTGRGEELARVRALLGEAARSGGGLARPVVISAIDGMAGIGKSALALQAAHEVAGRFPDGQLYVDLRGASGGDPPVWRSAVGDPDRRRAPGRPAQLVGGGAGRAAGRRHPAPRGAGGRELAVRASFEVSVRGLEHSADPLDRAAAESFGLLSLPNGPDLGLGAAARVLDQAEPATQALLERLVDAQLLESVRPGRYWFHDLVRLYARQHTDQRHPESVRAAALLRVLSFYTATTWATLALLRPRDRRMDTADPRWTTDGLQFSDAAAALGWLETERVNLLDAITQAATGAPAIPAGWPASSPAPCSGCSRCGATGKTPCGPTRSPCR